MIDCDVNIERGWIDERQIKKWARGTFKFLKIKNAAISVAVVDNKTIKKINKKYRNKNKPTDVLSFSEKDSSRFPCFFKNFLGEVVMSFEKTVEDAKEDGAAAEQIFKKLLVHGILHLLGYDHEKSKTEEKKMLELQKRILVKI